MRNLLVTGHSLINPRQHNLFREMAEQFPKLDILILPPEKWRDEAILPIKKMNFKLRPLEYLGTTFNFVRYWLKDLEKYLKNDLDVIYIEQEPYSLFTYTLLRLIKEDSPKTKVVIFSWENRMEIWNYYKYHGEYTDYCIKNADLIVCGNKLCESCIKQINPDTKMAICPQFGIDITEFKSKIRDESYAEPVFDLGSCGRRVEEKGVRVIENLAKDMKLNFLTTGGRGDYNYRYGTDLGWLKNYKSLSKEFYQKIKVFITLPYDHAGYSEQYNASIGEAMACKLPVICTDNGSISDVYKGSPAIMIPQKWVEENRIDLIKPIITTLLNDENERKRLGWDGRKWILDNISNRRISEQLHQIFKEL